MPRFNRHGFLGLLKIKSEFGLDMKNSCSTPGLFWAGLICSAALLGWAITRRISRKRKASSTRAVSEVKGEDPPSLSQNSGGSQSLELAAAVLALSALADSGVEHYGGCYFNPLMYAAPAISAVVLGESAAAAAGKPSAPPARAAVFSLAALTGAVGLGFHAYNIVKREGSLSWHNLFYGAPLGAPGAVFMAGVFGLSGEVLSGSKQKPKSEFAGPLLAGITVLGIAATIAEASLLHFRGAFQDPFQYVPVFVPAACAGTLCLAAADPSEKTLLAASAAMKVMGVTGIAGTAFHAYGIHRNMGGWGNWSQMILQGPPLPAPLGFTGLAAAGLAALPLLHRRKHNE